MNRLAAVRFSTWLGVAACLTLLCIVGAIPYLLRTPQRDDDSNNLYPDEFVAKWERDPNDSRRLQVVPRGEALPRGIVFQRLDIHESRLKNAGEARVNSVRTLWWQVSRSYYLECLSTTNGADGELPPFDPRKSVSDFRVLLLRELEWWQRPDKDRRSLGPILDLFR
jgi:hypothetical protein